MRFFGKTTTETEISKRLRERALLIKEIEKDGLKLKNAPELLRDDREVVEIAVYQNGLALAYASDRLRNDEEIVRAALQNDGAALEFAGQHADNIYMLRTAVSNNKAAYGFGSSRLKKESLIALSCMG